MLTYSWEFHTQPAHGMSGGAVLLDGKLVGIIQARDESENSGIVIPLAEIEEFLREHRCINKPSKLPEMQDNEFVKKVRGNIKDLLDEEGVVVFKEVLHKELNEVLTNLNLSIIGSRDTSELIDGLLIALEKGGKSVPVISEALLKATMSCLNKKYDKITYKRASENLEEIREVVQDLLGWLVVMSVVQEFNDQVSPELMHMPAIYFELPVTTEWGVEVLISRKFQRAASLNLDGSSLVGKHLFEFNWLKTTVVDDLKLELWNKVFPDRRKVKWNNDSMTDLKDLNASLYAQRKNPITPRHYYLATQPAGQFEDVYKDVCEQLLKELDELTVIRFGDPGGKQIFCTFEHYLMAAIREFLTEINKVRAS